MDNDPDYMPEDETNDVTIKYFELTRKAVKEELEYMHKHTVWMPMLRSEVKKANPKAKIIGTRWVIVNRGSDNELEI